ncbi:sensor histidine kinase [Dactylosporangium matsuzakiense]|uniref:histidine kinase n=1 Tax=Dactylosporangium matsuzakiense TaxID=53360 RepID=A0A9W6NKS0_9ACTN|nr:HAMP domain-containing sensor histidine kinase [Dactylosporangium matsuzakiense]UWZ42500.1 HAMP domain-containing histidine kinase [Dactylosporangium matsuzakiense]GLL00584.1 two-component sensor histidine kinase [Dactylosporangium matsuzakiense]
MRTPLGPAPEAALVRRARLRLGVGVGLVITALLALAGGISYAVLVRGQEAQISSELAWGAANGTVPGPPACSWVFYFAHGSFLGSNTPPPPGLPVWEDARLVAADGRPHDSRLTRDGTRYYVHTERRGDTVVQVVFDARFQLSDRRHLLYAFTLAALVGLLAAVLTGVLVGRHAVSPLIEALARQRRFVADASHELRTPIAQVHTRAQLLARRGSQERDLVRLVASTRRLGEIVDELLLSARLAADARPAVAPVDLAALATDAVAAESDLAAEGGRTITLTTPGGPLLVAGIESALRRVFSELLANALVHLPPGGLIAVTVARRGDLAEVVVSDTGTGFDPADADRIFDRFHRGAGAGERRHGLGLALVQEVVTGHGGTITARSGPGCGAEFAFRIPLLSMSDEVRAVRPRWLRRADPAPAGRGT